MFSPPGHNAGLPDNPGACHIGAQASTTPRRSLHGANDRGLTHSLDGSDRCGYCPGSGCLTTLKETTRGRRRLVGICSGSSMDAE